MVVAAPTRVHGLASTLPVHIAHAHPQPPASSLTLPPPALPFTPPPAELLSSVKKGQKVLLMCAIGGTLDTLVSYRREKRLFNDPERAFGRECRGGGRCGLAYRGAWAGPAQLCLAAKYPHPLPSLPRREPLPQGGV